MLHWKNQETGKAWHFWMSPHGTMTFVRVEHSSIPMGQWEQPAPNWWLAVWGMHLGPHGRLSLWHVGQWCAGSCSGANNAGAPLSSLGRVCRLRNLHSSEWGVPVIPKACERGEICT